MGKIGKIKTGIGGLDEKLAGGLPTGSIVLTLSNSESCVRMFCHQVAYNLAIEGCNVFYLTITKESQYIREEMALYDWDPTPFEKDKKWMFIDAYTPKVDMLMMKSKDININGHYDPFVSIRVDILSKLCNGGIVVVDSLSDLLLKYDIKSVVELLEVFSAVVRRKNGVGYMPIMSAMHEKVTLATFAHLSDVVIELTIDEAKFDGKIRFWKMRKARLEPFYLPFSVTERGIVADTFTRII